MVTSLMILLLVTALFLIMLILIQRGRGGGLAGAFGGMGGQSAFGTKAGDLFTKVTIGVAAFWILLSIVAVKYLSTTENRFDEGLGAEAQPSDRQFVMPEADQEQDQSDTSAPGDAGADDSSQGNVDTPASESGDAQDASPSGRDDGF